MARTEAAAFRLFARLYKRKRSNDGREEISKEKLQKKILAHWKAMTREQRSRYATAAEYRHNREVDKRRHVSRHEGHYGKASRRSRVQSESPDRSRRSERHSRSRSLCSRTDHGHSRSRSQSCSSTQTALSGESSESSCYTRRYSSSNSDTSTDRTGKTSCASIETSYDDSHADNKPTTSKGRHRTSSKRTKDSNPRKLNGAIKGSRKKTEPKEATNRPTKKPANIQTVTKTAEKQTVRSQASKKVPARRRKGGNMKLVPLKKVAGRTRINLLTNQRKEELKTLPPITEGKTLHRSASEGRVSLPRKSISMQKLAETHNVQREFSCAL